MQDGRGLLPAPVRTIPRDFHVAIVEQLAHLLEVIDQHDVAVVAIRVHIEEGHFIA
jgi:hypothetical protein